MRNLFFNFKKATSASSNINRKQYLKIGFLRLQKYLHLVGCIECKAGYTTSLNKPVLNTSLIGVCYEVRN
jgi:hypothetical protein